MPQWLDEMTNAGEPGIPKMLYDEVWERDEAQCTKCGATEDIDVYCITPYGMPTESNSKILCKACKRLL